MPASSVPWAGVIAAFRSGLLIGLIALFSIALVQGVLRDRSAWLVSGGDGLGADPGIRVLLLSREGGPDQRQIKVEILQRAVLVFPDEPERPGRDLGIHEILLIRPDSTDGMVVSGPALGSDLALPLRRLLIAPALRGGEVRSDGGLPDPTAFEAADRGPVFALENRRFRGNLEVHLTGARTVAAVNALPIEAWLTGMVQVEMAPSWPEHALKAQAVAGRTYAYARRVAGGLRGPEAPPWDLRDSDPDPDYRGVESGSRAIDWAILETRGQVLTWGGMPFLAQVHAASGGRTGAVTDLIPNARTADGSLSLAVVMPGQDDPWHQLGLDDLRYHSSHGRRSEVIEIQPLRNALVAPPWNHRDGWPTDIVVTRDAGGRIRTVTLRTMQKPDIEMSGEQFRQLLGPARIRSTRWSPESPRRVEIGTGGGATVGWEITTDGWGHGVGMPQVSAYAQARRGRSFTEILSTWYLGAALERRW